MTPAELLRLALDEPDRLERALELARRAREIWEEDYEVEAHEDFGTRILQDITEVAGAYEQDRAAGPTTTAREGSGETTSDPINVDRPGGPAAPKEGREAPDSASADLLHDWHYGSKPAAPTPDSASACEHLFTERFGTEIRCIDCWALRGRTDTPAAPTPTAAAEPGGELPQAEPSGSPPGDSPDPGPIPDFLDRRKEA